MIILEYFDVHHLIFRKRKHVETYYRIQNCCLVTVDKDPKLNPAGALFARGKCYYS